MITDTTIFRTLTTGRVGTDPAGDSSKPPGGVTRSLRDLRRSGSGTEVALSRVPGLTMTGEGRGRLDFDPNGTTVCLEPLENIHIRRTLRMSGNRLPAALRVSGRLPGNVRVARRGNRTALAADIFLHNGASPEDAFADLRPVFEQAERLFAGEDPNVAGPGEPAPPTDAMQSNAGDRLRQLLDANPWPGEAIVSNDDSWEVRPRLRGSVAPVRLTIAGAAVLVQRPVVDRLPEGNDDDRMQALADHAARVNGRLRGARLAVDENRLIAETRLPPVLLGPESLKRAIYAVAVAAHRAAPILTILARQPDIAGSYVRMFRTAEKRSVIRAMEP